MFSLQSIPILAILSLVGLGAATDNPLLLGGPQALNYRKYRLETQKEHAPLGSRAEEDFPALTFTQPLDHFDVAYRGHTWEQRYWISTRNYNGAEDAPVIVLDGGETSGVGRLKFMDTGIVEHLTKATGGVGIILEHRYYGESIPVRNFSTDSLRWLTNEQALEDSANFMRNVDFSQAGISKDMTAPNTKWIYYGGSYAGGRAAHMRVLYPDIVYGAIASSGVTVAIYDYWHYLDTVRRALNQTCSDNLVGSVETVDEYLDGGDRRVRQIKTLFGLQDLSLVGDFGATIGWFAYGDWQTRNWDPALSNTKVEEFCAFLDAPPPRKAYMARYPYGHRKRRVSVKISRHETLRIDYALANYGAFIKENVVAPVADRVEQVFGTNNDTAYLADDISQDWRLWTFQYCNVWGYYQGVAPAYLPTIMSKTVDTVYNSKICKQSFPPGEFVTVPEFPDLDAVNRLGGFDIAYDRLAFIDGEVDPWRAAGPQSEYDGTPREDTLTRPFKLLPGAVHHWDENGLFNIEDEPPLIREVHYQMIDFVKAWLAGEA